MAFKTFNTFQITIKGKYTVYLSEITRALLNPLAELFNAMHGAENFWKKPEISLHIKVFLQSVLRYQHALLILDIASDLKCRLHLSI